MQVKSIAECSKGSILQYFGPSLSYHLLLRYLFCLSLSGRLRQVLLYNGLFACFITYAGYPFDGDFSIDIERDGSYRLVVQNDTWLHSAPTFFRFDNNTFSTSNGTLQLKSFNQKNGKDAIGRYTQTTMSYVAKRRLVEFEVSITAYQDVPLILFTQLPEFCCCFLCFVCEMKMDCFR